MFISLFALSSFSYAQQGIGNYVWVDSNEDGVQNPTEKGLSQVNVSLYDTSNTIIAVMRTDAFGAYFFNNIPVGNYKIRISLPVDYIFSPKNVVAAGGNPATDSDINPATGYTDLFSLVANTNNNDIDAALHAEKSDITYINSFVWLDADANGIQDVGERGMSNVGVILLDNAGNIVQTTLTDGNGNYQLSTYTSGNYRIAFRTPFGYTFTPKNVIGSTLITDSDVNENGAFIGKTDVISLSTGNNIVHIDAGFIPTNMGSMGSFVWNDLNQNGIQNVGEMGIANVAVLLMDTANTVVANTLTDGLGFYAFTNLAAGIYYVSFGNPAGYIFTNREKGNGNNDSDANPATGSSEWFILGAGERIAHIDAGLYQQFPAGGASIGDLLWFDKDRNGIQDVNESGIAGVTVLLYDGVGTLLQKMITHSTGNYLFPNLAAGTYSVEFQNIPQGFIFTKSHVGGNFLDNDAEHDGRIYNIVLASNTAITDIDAGIYPAGSQIGKAAIGNRVWNDINGNGLQDVAERGVKGVDMVLYASDGMTVLNTTKTDGDGKYLFNSLAKGKYFVGIASLPVNFNVVSQNVGGNRDIDNDVDNTGMSAAIFVGQGENSTNIDAGLQNLVNTASVSNFVWDDLNNNGIQNGGELGVPNVSVTLYDNNNARIDVSLTDEVGNYAFPNLAPGTYYVGFNNLMAGYTFGLQLQGGNTTTDSDPNPATGFTNMFAITPAQVNNNIDAALLTSRAMIGNFVWYDKNVNGIQDAGEKGLEGVTVSLYNNLNSLISHTITNEKGEYYFSNLNAGQYILGYTTLYDGLIFTAKDTLFAGANNNNDNEVNPATGLTDAFSLVTKNINYSFDAGLTITEKGSINGYAWQDTNEDGVQDSTEQAAVGIAVTLYAFDGTTILGNTVTDARGNYYFYQLEIADYILNFSGLPNNYTFSQLYQGGDISLDSDADKDGFSATYTLQAGEDMEGADAGIINRAITLGDFVFEDKDHDGIRDDTDPGIANITVTLYDGNTQILSVTKTDAYGRYAFINQGLGDYEIGFSLPVDYVFTLQGSGGNKDSDVSPLTGKTGVFSITYEKDTFDIDAGMYFPETVLSNIGDYVWFDSNNDGLQDANEKGMSNVTVMLFDNNNRLLLTTITDERGFYQFLDIPAGNYYIGLTVPHGYTFTLPNMGINEELDSDVLTNLGYSDLITLGLAEKQQNWDIGLRRLLAMRPDIGDCVWNDLNQNGIQEVGESGVGGVVLNLYNINNTFLLSTKTDAFGNYLFSNLVQGLYKMTLILPSGWTQSPLNIGNTDTDNDFDATNTTVFFALSEGDKITDLDAGIFQTTPAGTSALGDKVWNDVNVNGLQEAGEAGIAGITVVLLNSLLSAIDTATTNINGDFRFVSLAAGTYYIQLLNLPEGLYFTAKDADGIVSNTTDSDPNPATGITDAIVLGAGSYDATIDAGLIQQTTNSGAGSLGNLVWYDKNANGQQDADEAGVQNVLVTLTDLSTNATTLTRTDGLGYYIFNNLVAGNYKITVSLPATYTFSPQNAAAIDIDSDINPATSESNTIVLAIGESNVSVDAGIYQSLGTASIGNRVWNDSNNNGIQEAGEAGFSGITVTLYDALLAPVSVTSTDIAGKYLFSYLPTGLYTLGFSHLPDGFAFSLKDQSGNDNTDSDVRPNMTITAPFRLSAGISTLNLAAGVHTTTRSSLGDYVWYDTDNDGLQTVGELPVVGSTVVLYDGGSNEIAKSVTDDRGNYYFSNLFPGSYWIGYRTLAPGAKPSIYQVGGGANASLDNDASASGLTDEQILLAGDANASIDAGIGTAASVGLLGYAWYDYQDMAAATNGNGLQDIGEKPVVGVSVGLYPGTSNALLATAVTDAEGMYYFQGLTPGSYRIKISAFPLNVRLSLQDQGNDAIDSDIDPVFLQSPAYTAPAGANTHIADIGLIPPAAITGTAFQDGQMNVVGSADGFQNYQIANNNTTPIDSGIKFVSVILLDAITGNVVRNTYTTEKGDYFFRNLDEDNDYIVAFEQNPTYCPSCPYTLYNADNNVNDTTDSDVNQGFLFNYAGKNHAYADTVTGLSPMQLRRNVDGGYAMSGTILPVKLIDLTAEWQEIDGLITWHTSEEIGTDHFAIERSLDRGQTFEEIGQVHAIGNSTETQAYEYWDMNIGNTSQNEILYRLRIIDVEGYEEYSDMVSLYKNDLRVEMALEVFPNPTQDLLHINYQVPEYGKLSFIVRNELGQEIDKQVFSAKNRPLSVEFDLKNYPSGKYFIQMSAPSEVLTKVVIKE